MIVYHVTSYRKLKRYMTSGYINPPVRAWETIEEAQRMSLSSGRRVIVRLKFPDNALKLEGHFNKARVMHSKLRMGDL